jgi:hypothetical protein
MQYVRSFVLILSRNNRTEFGGPKGLDTIMIYNCRKNRFWVFGSYLGDGGHFPSFLYERRIGVVIDYSIVVIVVAQYLRSIIEIERWE